MMLKQDCDETTERSEHRMVDHERDSAATVRCDVRGVETCRENTVQLDGATLPRSPHTIAKGEFQFGTVESAFARLYRERHPAPGRGIT